MGETPDSLGGENDYLLNNRPDDHTDCEDGKTAPHKDVEDQEKHWPEQPVNAQQAAE